MTGLGILTGQANHENPDRNALLSGENKKMTAAIAKLEWAAGEGERAKLAAETLRVKVDSLQERNDKYKEVHRIQKGGKYECVANFPIQDLRAIEEELKRLQSEREKQMEAQLAEYREEIARLRREQAATRVAIQ